MRLHYESLTLFPSLLSWAFGLDTWGNIVLIRLFGWVLQVRLPK